MNDEIVAKFGSNTTGFQQGIDKMRQGTAQAGETAHKSFVHASNGAREFHKLLHGIGEQSPIMGTLLRTAIAPMAGIFAGVGIVVQKTTEFIGELNKQMDELGRSAEQPLYKIASLLRAAKHEAAKFHEEFFAYRNKPEKDKDLEYMEDKLALIKAQAAEAAKLSPDKAKDIDLATTKLQLDLQKRALNSTEFKKVDAEEKMGMAFGMNEAALRDPTIAKAMALVKRGEKDVEEMKADLRIKEAAKASFGGMLINPIMGEKMDEDILRVKQKIHAAEQRIDENNETILRETEHRKKLADKLAEAKGVYEQYKAQFETIQKQLIATGQHLSILTGMASPEHAAIAPSTVRAGQWSANNAKYASDMWNYNNEKAQQDWRRDHGMSWHDVTMPVNANKSGNAVKDDVASLNELFSGIVTKEGMKVTFRIDDNE